MFDFTVILNFKRSIQKFFLRISRILVMLVFLIQGTTYAEEGEQPLEATEAAADLNRVLDDISGKVNKIELNNGIRLLIMKREYAPIASYYIKFLAGGSDETVRTQGIAHMLEHMLFKGTPNIGTKDFEKEEKYLKVINSWARRMDEWKRKLDEAEKNHNKETATKARTRVGKWQKRISSLSSKAREYMVMDEDSYLYSLHGQRGYNAYTSRDLTNYQIELPSNRTEVWARLESDRVKNSVLRDFYTERDVVAEERRMRVDNRAHNLLMEMYLQEVFGDHPYGKPLIGSMDSIRYMSYEDAHDFYKTFYAPNNMVISIVGDVDSDEIQQIVDDHFGAMNKISIPRNHAEAPSLKKNVHITLKKEGSPFQIMGWFKPPMPHPDDLNLEILGRILAGTRDTRLFKKLVIQDRLASQVSIYSSYPGERYTNLFLVSAVPAPGKSYDEVEQAILTELDRVRNEGVTEDELARVKKSLAAEMIYSLRSNSSLADRLSYYETVTGDYRIMFDVYSHLEKITSKDIRQAARKYLNPEFKMTARLLPLDESKGE